MRASRAVTNWLALGGGVSAMGDAITALIVPVFIYVETRSPFLTALQVTAMALGNLTGSYLLRRFGNIFDDRDGCVRIDTVCALVILIPAGVPGTGLLIALYTCGFILAALQTARSGYNESLIGHATHGDMAGRQAAVGRIKTWVNVGSATGFLVAAPLSALSYRVAFAINALTFLASALSLCMVPCQGAAKASPSPAVKILMSRALRWLSVSHGISAISLFFFNGTAVYLLKDHYQVSEVEVALFFVLQFCGAIAGSWVAAWLGQKGGIRPCHGTFLRALYGVPFVLSACFDSLAIFFMASVCLALIHAFSIPLWQSMFQASAQSAEWRLVGASRKTLVALVGAVSSAMSGALYGHYGYQLVFLIAAFAAAISARFLALHIRSMPTQREGKDQDEKRSFVA